MFKRFSVWQTALFHFPAFLYSQRQREKSKYNAAAKGFFRKKTAGFLSLNRQHVPQLEDP